MKAVKLFVPVALVAIAVLLGASSPRRISADATGAPHLEIDANVTNGTGPCNPIDSIRNGAPTSGTYTVAICLDENGGAPDGFEARVVWGGGVATAPEVADSGDALDDNPDFNQSAGPGGNGPNWSCNAFQLAFPKGDDPATASTDAYIACNNKGFVAGQLTATRGLLALITMAASGSGTETFNFSTNGSSSLNSPAGVNQACGLGITCLGGTVVQAVDTDGDGCPDNNELGPDRHKGGVRDPNSPWDFFDVPAPALTAGDTSGRRNNAVALQDVLAVLFYSGAVSGGGSNVNGVSYNTDLDANSVPDGRQYDRTPSSDGTKPWRSGPPNSAVTLQDALVVLSQVSDSCVLPP